MANSYIGQESGAVGWANFARGMAVPALLVIAPSVAGFYAGGSKHRVLGTGLGLGAGGALWFAFSKWQEAKQRAAFLAMDACLASKGFTPEGDAAIARMPDGADKEAALMRKVAAIDACAQAA